MSGLRTFLMLQGSSLVHGNVVGTNEDTGQLLLHRYQFGLNLIYHYLYPQLTMGLIFLIVILETIYLRNGDEAFRKAANFWSRIFAPAFVIGAVTGIPLEFGFGTNWAVFSTVNGGVIGQTVAMEGVFAFFVESAFLGVYLFGGEAFGRRVRWFSAFMVFLGSWASAFFILSVNSWMQHPVGYKVLPDGNLGLDSFWQIVLNPWLFHQFIHVIGGTVVTASFVMTGLGAYYLLARRDEHYARMFITIGVVVGLLAVTWQAYPSGDIEAKAVAALQPTKLAAEEGVFKTQTHAPEILFGLVDMKNLQVINPIQIPAFLSFLAKFHFAAPIKGLNAFPKSVWPDNVPLIFYAYRVMVGIQGISMAVYALAAFLLWRKRLFESRPVLWLLLALTPLPFVANTAGWVNAEVGRQPWAVYDLMRTADSASFTVQSGYILFTLIGLLGMFLILSLVYVLLLVKEVYNGPEPAPDEEKDEEEVREAVRGTMHGNPPHI